MIIFRLLLLSFLLNSSANADVNYLRDNFICLGKSLRKNAKDEIVGYLNGTWPIISFQNYYISRAQYRLDRAETCTEIEVNKQIPIAMKESLKNHFKNDSVMQLTDIGIQSKENFIYQAKLASMNGELIGFFNNSKTEFDRELCYYEKNKNSKKCEEIVNLFLGNFIAIDLIARRYFSDGADNFPYDRMQLNLINKVAEYNFNKTDRILFKMLQFYKEERLDYLNAIAEILEKESKETNKITLSPYILTNPWRVNSTILSLGADSKNRSYSEVRNKAANKMYIQIPSLMSSINLKPSIDSTELLPSEFHANLEELKSYFKTTGELDKVENITQMQGLLRSESSSLIKSKNERWVQKNIWGKLTSYGTSFSSILKYWVYLAILNFLVIYLYRIGLPETYIRRKRVKIKSKKINIKFPVVRFQKCFIKIKSLDTYIYTLENAVSILIMQQGEKPLPIILGLIMRVVAFIYASFSMGYLINFLNRSF